MIAKIFEFTTSSSQGKTKSAPRSSTPTQLLPTQNSADFQTTDSDEEKDPVRGTNLHTKMSDVTSLNCFNNDKQFFM